VKAIVQDAYGGPDLLRLQEIGVPVAGEQEVLVRVHAAGIDPDVWHVLRGLPYVLRIMGSGLRRPRTRVPGRDLAGIVDSVGRGVGRFRPGDKVFGVALAGNLWRNGGAYAEFAAVQERFLEPKPPGLTWERSAAVPTSGPLAVQGLRDEGRMRAGQRVLIVGAGGGVGTFAVQIAKAWGAAVTGVDRGDKLDTVRSIGADRVIDHLEEDYTRSGERYDLILDIASARPFSEVRRALTPEGQYVLIGHDQYGRSGHHWFGSLGRFAKLLAISPFSSQLPGLRGARDPGDRLRVVTELIEAGSVVPVIDRTYPLEQVPAALRFLEEGSVVGKVVVTVGS
jgi:NADPH:quinone reductase-like Zn-dependent oxidoreductase